MAEFNNPSLVEITNLMCEIGQTNTWRRGGKRNYPMLEKMFIGVRLVLIKRKTGFTLESPFRWRITLQTISEYDGWTYKPVPGSIKLNLPYPGEGWKTELLQATFKPNYTPQFEIMIPHSFQRDWVMMRMFASQYAHFNAPNDDKD